MTSEITYSYTKKVRAVEINELMSAALMGMGYWADDAELVNDDMGAYRTSQGLTKGYTVRIHDAEEDKWHTLTIEKLMNGLSLTDNLDFENYDMYDAERVVQRALFGKVLYA